MKIYYDTQTRNVTIENINRFFASGSLIATADGSNVAIKYVNTDRLEIYDVYTLFKQENGTSAGATVGDVVNYLNGEFNKGIIMGQSSFSGLGTTRTVTDSRIKPSDKIVITPIGTINEVLGVTVTNGAFTVTRSVVATLVGLTNNLTFDWVRM